MSPRLDPPGGAPLAEPKSCRREPVVAPRAPARYSSPMIATSVRARVKNGRLTLDEPTDLPEGTEVELVPTELDDEWNLSDEEVALLQKSITQADCGAVVPADVVLRELRATK